MNPIIFLISWFAAGLIGTIIMLVHDFRGTEYNKDDFDSNLFWYCFAVTTLGHVSIIIIFVYIFDEKIMHLRGFGFYIHKLVNIGVKKEKDK